MNAISLKDLKSGKAIDEPVIYASKPYVLTGNEKCVLDAGTLDELKALPEYYDECIVSIRKYDLYLNDNTKIWSDFVI